MCGVVARDQHILAQWSIDTGNSSSIIAKLLQKINKTKHLQSFHHKTTQNELSVIFLLFLASFSAPLLSGFSSSAIIFMFWFMKVSPFYVLLMQVVDKLFPSAFCKIWRIGLVVTSLSSNISFSSLCFLLIVSRFPLPDCVLLCFCILSALSLVWVAKCQIVCTWCSI